MADEKKQENSGEGAIQITGDNVTVVQIGQLLTSLAESTLQANFYATTGMRCGREVRMQMENLMEVHGFTSRELAHAWQTHAIVAEGRDRRLRVASRVLDLTMGWSGAALASLLVVAGMVDVLGVLKPSGHAYPVAAASGWVFGYMAAIGFLSYTFIWPQHTAKRVRQALYAQ